MSRGRKGFGSVGAYLTPIDSTKPIKSRRTRFGVIDIESKAGDTQDPGFTRPFLIGFHNPQNQEYVAFRDEPHLKSRPWERRHMLPGGCIDKMMNYILVPEYKGWGFYAHNGGNFDWLHILAWLREHQDEYGCEIIPVQSTIQVMRVWKKPEEGDPIVYEWDFLDSIKLMNMSLQKCCDTFDIPGKREHDLALHEDHKDWEKYLEQDCKALSQVMMKLFNLVEDKLGGEVGITTPSTSIKLFRRCYQGRNGCPNRIARYAHFPKCKLRGTRKNPGPCEGCQHDWILSGYYGGRTEIHRTYGQHLHYYDFNSSYVASMHEDMPIGKRVIEYGQITWSRHRSEKNPKGKYSGFAECVVYIPQECDIPPLPYRNEKTKKLMFRSGRFRGVWSLEELALLEHPLVNGQIEEVFNVVWFELLPMFQAMVTALWRYRDPKQPDFDPGLSRVAKDLGNGGYGKFAMKRARTSIVFEKKDRQPETCMLCEAPTLHPDRQICPGCAGSKTAGDSVDCDVWYRKHTVDANYIIPHIAAHITASARKRLWLAMAMVKDLGGKIYYLDTDSLIVDIVLPSSDKLGELKDEYPGELLTFSAVQPKVYMIETEVLNEVEVPKRLQMLKELGIDPKTGEFATFDYDLDPNVQNVRSWKPVKQKLALTPYAKVTMKGFPGRERTKENLAKLRAGETLDWTQLEKIRSLARVEFKRPPKMRNVKKSFQCGYAKREFIPGDPEGATRPWYLIDKFEDESTFHEDKTPVEEAEAAE